MGKYPELIIAGVDCEDCKHCFLQEESKAKVCIYCDIKDSIYYYGQYVPCDFKEKVEA